MTFSINASSLSHRTTDAVRAHTRARAKYRLLREFVVTSCDARICLGVRGATSRMPTPLLGAPLARTRSAKAQLGRANSP